MLKAAELGNAIAHYLLSILYDKGEGVKKDEKKVVFHLEQAAMGGNPFARNSLPKLETLNGRHDRAVKHNIIAAKLGEDCALESLKLAYEGAYKQRRFCRSSSWTPGCSERYKKSREGDSRSILSNEEEEEAAELR